ncbi:zinc finger MYM-type protein 1-like protein [Tanacetum coccineum]
MDNYVIKFPHVSSSNNEDVGGGDNKDEYVDEDGLNNTDVNNEDVDDVNNEDVDDVKLDYNDDDDDVPIEETHVDYDHVEDVDVDINVDIFDPRNWDSLNSDMIKRLVEQRVQKEINLLRRVLKIKVLDDYATYYTRILYAVNLVSKKLQSNDMLIDIAIKEVKGLISFFEEFREMGLSKAINDAKEIAVEMDIDLVFVQKRVIH